jgi:hypothetical protein
LGPIGTDGASQYDTLDNTTSTPPNCFIGAHRHRWGISKQKQSTLQNQHRFAVVASLPV